MIDFVNENIISLELKNRLNKKMFEVLEFLNQPKNLECCLNFVSGLAIKKLNRVNRDKNAITDVLSFPSMNVVAGVSVDEQSDDAEMLLNKETKTIFIGDVVICLAVAKKQAKEFGHSLDDEIERLFVHSLLHLLGYDHIKDEDFEKMNKIERMFCKA